MSGASVLQHQGCFSTCFTSSSIFLLPPFLPQPPQTQLMQFYQTWSDLWFGSPHMGVFVGERFRENSAHSPSCTLYPPHSEQLCNFSFDVFFPCMASAGSPAPGKPAALIMLMNVPLDWSKGDKCINQQGKPRAVMPPAVGSLLLLLGYSKTLLCVFVSALSSSPSSHLCEKSGRKGEAGFCTWNFVCQGHGSARAF